MAVGEGKTAGAIVVTGGKVDDSGLSQVLFGSHFYGEGGVVDSAGMLVHQNPSHGRAGIGQFGFFSVDAIFRWINGRQPSSVVKALAHGVAANARPSFAVGFDGCPVRRAFPNFRRAAGIFKKRAFLDVHCDIPVVSHVGGIT